jgi:hypothetical protein
MKDFHLSIWALVLITLMATGSGFAQEITFPKGTATDSQECGACLSPNLNTK